MGFLDELLGAGTTDTVVDTLWETARDVIPTFGVAEDLLRGVGIIPPSPSPAGSSRGIPAISINPSSGGQTSGGGATGMWNGGFDLTTTGMRGLVPFQGQGPPAPGYHIARRPQRRPTAGRAAGLYWVPRRTMNPLNPRALLRAERRMSSFTKWVKRHFTIQSSMPRRRKAASRKVCFTPRRK